MTPTSRAHAPAHPVDLESRAIAMLDDEQLWATFYRWRTVLRGETAARSLREKLGVEEYVAAIYREIPA
jgi:hypothetical protein